MENRREVYEIAPRDYCLCTYNLLYRTNCGHNQCLGFKTATEEVATAASTVASSNGTRIQT